MELTLNMFLFIVMTACNITKLILGFETLSYFSLNSMNLSNGICHQIVF